jgi:hypothetical protein
MTTKMALCPDGKWRAYTVTGDIATVQVRSRRSASLLANSDALQLPKEVEMLCYVHRAIP